MRREAPYRFIFGGIVGIEVIVFLIYVTYWIGLENARVERRSRDKRNQSLFLGLAAVKRIIAETGNKEFIIKSSKLVLI